MPSKATVAFTAMLLAALSVTTLIAYFIPFVLFGAYSIGSTPFGYVGGITDSEMIASVGIAIAVMCGMCYSGTILVEAKVKS